jgi:hypothetical protein
VINFDKVQRIGTIVFSIGLHSPELLAFPFVPDTKLFSSINDEIMRAQPAESLVRYLNDLLQRRAEEIDDRRVKDKSIDMDQVDEDEELLRAVRLKKVRCTIEPMRQCIIIIMQITTTTTAII